MSPGMHTERAFEDAVYELVQEQGWHPGPANWRPELGIDTGRAERIYADIEAKRRATRYLHLPPLLAGPIDEVGA